MPPSKPSNLLTLLYSNFYVGGAVLTEQGKIITEYNVENASDGLTIWTERSALPVYSRPKASLLRVWNRCESCPSAVLAARDVSPSDRGVRRKRALLSHSGETGGVTAPHSSRGRTGRGF